MWSPARLPRRPKTRTQPRTNEDLPDDQDALIELAERKIQELSLVNKVSEAVNSTLNLERLLDIALEQSMAAVGADAGSLMLINKETNKLEIVASRGLAKRLVKHAAQRLGSSISGWVAAERRERARSPMPARTSGSRCLSFATASTPPPRCR